MDTDILTYSHRIPDCAQPYQLSSPRSLVIIPNTAPCCCRTISMGILCGRRVNSSVGFVDPVSSGASSYSVPSSVVTVDSRNDTPPFILPASKVLGGELFQEEWRGDRDLSQSNSIKPQISTMIRPR